MLPDLSSTIPTDNDVICSVLSILSADAFFSTSLAASKFPAQIIQIANCSERVDFRIPRDALYAISGRKTDCTYYTASKSCMGTSLFPN